MRSTHLIALATTLIFCTSAQLSGQSSIPAELGRIERLKKVYQDPANKPLTRARSLEQIITAYGQLVDSESKTPRTMRQILDGEIKCRLILAKLLVSERARQGRFAVEELGLAGGWSKDLGKTLDRLDSLLKPTSDRLKQLSQHMRADANFERNYVVTGLSLRLTRAKIQADYYQGWYCFYRSILSDQPSEQKQLLKSAVKYLRRCIATDRASKKAGVGEPVLDEKAVLLMCKVLRRLGQLGQADKMLTWLEAQKLDEQLAYQVGLERCRLLATQGHYDMALVGLKQVRSWCVGKRAFDQLPVRLTLAYLQCRIQATKAAKLALGGNLQAARQISRQRLEELAKIFRLQTSAQIRGIIYEQIRQTRLADVPNAAMASLELLAMGVGSAEQGQSTAALKYFDELLSRTDADQLRLHAEALWQAGQAGQKDTPLQACAYLGRLAEGFPDSPQAKPGLMLAVQISAKLCQDRPNNQAAEQYCFKALERLMSRYPDAEQATTHWRFYWAGLLSKRGELAKADEQFGQISKEHPLYAQARYYQLNLRRQLIDSQSAPDKAPAYARLAQEFLDLDSYVRSGAGPTEHADETAQSFGARARLKAVRILCVELNEPQKALLQLDSFSSDFAGQPELLSQAQRYRAVALTEKGQLTEAGRLTIQLLRDDHSQTLEIADALLRRMDQRFADVTDEELSSEKKELAHCWMQLAQARLELIQKSDSPAEHKAQAIVAGKEMLARGMFAAGELDKALDIFDRLQRTQPQSAQYIRMVGKILLAQKKYDAAAQQWQQLMRGLKRNSPAWFEAWYQALRTNYEAGGDREKIARRIKQLQELDKQMGSAQTLAKFEKLRSELQMPSVTAK